MTILYTDDRFLDHETGTHRERPERLKVIKAELARTGLAARCKAGETRVASVEEIARIHGVMYVGRVAEYAKEGGGWIERDTFMSPKSFDVACRAVGTGIAAVDAVMQGPDKTALCLVRPPGHHALAHDAMGFCLFNNIALAADHAVQLFGGRGWSTLYRPGRHLMDVRVCRIYEGTDEILKLRIAAALLGGKEYEAYK